MPFGNALGTTDIVGVVIPARFSFWNLRSKKVQNILYSKFKHAKGNIDQLKSVNHYGLDTNDRSDRANLYIGYDHKMVSDEKLATLVISASYKSHIILCTRSTSCSFYAYHKIKKLHMGLNQLNMKVNVNTRLLSWTIDHHSWYIWIDNLAGSIQIIRNVW